MPSHDPRRSLEEIVAQVGRYPIDAYFFIQECVGLAADRVHGALTPEQVEVAKWMSKEEIGPEQLDQMSRAGELPAEIATQLDNAGGPGRMNRHITGQQLCRVIRDFALERWGLMARSVLTRWQILRTEDIGVIIFALVENDWLQKQPADSIDDFNQVFDFDEAFDQSYQIGVG
jgi:uncharacterized repeat protein (TIGR04138 family)